MLVRCVWEHNGDDSLVYADGYVGAYTRGASRQEALSKFQMEMRSYLLWSTGEIIDCQVETEVIEEKASALNIADADSDVLFENEKRPLTQDEYRELKRLAMKSAVDFERLYESIPDKYDSVLPGRKTFYGEVPRTARQMYAHTKGVNSYYFGEIGVDCGNEGTIVACRKHGFDMLELMPDFLHSRVFDGSYGEQWTLRKVCRRFVWHDRLHAKAMYRMGCKTFGAERIPDVFYFRGQK
ncbi:MAG: hypothetical protein GX549_03345 [Clostridiales bacterium]|nr:hypothetical protein [Clostridiales bacterium]